MSKKLNVLILTRTDLRRDLNTAESDNPLDLSPHSFKGSPRLFFDKDIVAYKEVEEDYFNRYYILKSRYSDGMSEVFIGNRTFDNFISECQDKLDEQSFPNYDMEEFVGRFQNKYKESKADLIIAGMRKQVKEFSLLGTKYNDPEDDAFDEWMEGF